MYFQMLDLYPGYAFAGGDPADNPLIELFDNHVDKLECAVVQKKSKVMSLYMV